MSIIVIVIILLLVFGGGGYYGRGRWYGEGGTGFGNPMGIIWILLMVIIIVWLVRELGVGVIR
jgi:hypothetical protein